jgi:transcriptional regulator
MADPPRTDVAYGTLSLLILKTLDVLGPLHGYALARRIEQISEDRISLNQGTLYPTLRKLEEMRWVAGKWGQSETGRKARFYAITRAGQKQLRAETESWERTNDIVSRFVRGLS